MPEPTHVDPKDVSLLTAMQALSDPLRLAILDVLDRQGESECSAIYTAIGANKTNASHHFKVLRHAGLIWRDHEGSKQTARLRREEFDARFPGLLASVLTGLRS